nr:YbaB/EbfC family nucleoid-associated protein [Halonatronum saccharophilum]
MIIMNMNKMMKQVQKMQGQMAKMQEELADKTVDATVGGGVVTVTANGKQEIVDIKIDPDAIDPDDVEMLEDLILAATNEALRKMQEMTNKEMGKLTGGMNIPGLF